VKADLETEVCVIGGGPAGSSFAHRLAALGHQVHLIEQSEFPRSHVGESLPPTILSSLDMLGLREQIENARFLRPTRSLLLWSTQKEYSDFRKASPGFQVDRGRFDMILLAAAREVGVQVLQPAVGGQPVREVTSGWIVPVFTNGRSFTIHARFLAIATGKKHLLPGRKKQRSATTLALYAYWQNSGIKGPETRIEAARDHWFWGAPLPDGTFNATVFIDPGLTRIAGRAAVKQTYLSLLSQSELLRQCREGDLGDILVCNASSYLDEDCIYKDFIRIGEACFAIDPLSSQGVQAAITSALQGSVAVHTMLTLPENAQLAIDYYRCRQAETSNHHELLAARNYARQYRFKQEPFWQRRAYCEQVSNAPDQKIDFSLSGFGNGRLRKSQALTFSEIPCIQGDVVRPARALNHPNLERPVVFVDGIEVAPLLDAILGECTAAEIVNLWLQHMEMQKSLDVLSWLISRGILKSSA